MRNILVPIVIGFASAVTVLPQESAKDLYTRGNVLVEQKDIPGAITEYSKAIAQDPNFIEAYRKRGIARLASKNYAGAIKDLELVRNARESDPLASFELAEAKMAMGDSNGASIDYSRTIDLDPRNSAAYYRRATIRGFNLDWAGELSDYTKALEIEPGNADYLASRGLARHLRKDIDGAISDYTAAIRIDPLLKRAYLGRAELRSSKNEVVGAIDDYTKLIELAPYEKRAYRARAEQNLKLKNYSAAIADYTKLLQLFPRDFYIFSARAEAYRLNNDLDLAMEDYRIAERVYPSDVNVIAGIGMIHLTKNRYESAVLYFSKAIEIRPIDPLFFRARAAAYRALTRNDKANDDLKRAAEIENMLAPKK